MPSTLYLDFWCLMMFTCFSFESSNRYLRRHKRQPPPTSNLNLYNYKPWDTFCTFCKASAVLQVHLQRACYIDEGDFLIIKWETVGRQIPIHPQDDKASDIRHSTLRGSGSRSLPQPEHAHFTSRSLKPWGCRKNISHPRSAVHKLIPVIQFVHFSHWTGASSLHDSMQHEVLRSHRTGREHLLGVPIFLEVSTSRTVVLKVWTPDYQHRHHWATWWKCSDLQNQNLWAEVQWSMFTGSQVILKHNKLWGTMSY